MREREREKINERERERENKWERERENKWESLNVMYQTLSAWFNGKEEKSDKRKGRYIERR